MKAKVHYSQLNNDNKKLWREAEKFKKTTGSPETLRQIYMRLKMAWSIGEYIV